MIELRSQSRYPRRLDVTLSVQGEEYRGCARDLSLGGLFAEALVDLAVGAAVEVSFVVPTMRGAVRAPATVRWVQRDGSSVVGVGLKLEAIGAVQQWGLNRFFAQEPS